MLAIGKSAVSGERLIFLRKLPLGHIDGKTHFPLIQTLRGVAALWVVLFHCAEGHHIDELLAVLPEFLQNLLFNWGHFGVPIFFAISGFVIAHSLRDVALDARSLGRFALRRSIRLDPPYWMAILFAVLMAFTSAKVTQEPFSWPSATNIIAHLFYLQLILDQPVINTAFWTLTFEIQFYLFFALMLTIAARFKTMRRVCWLAMFLIAAASAVHGFGWLPEGLFPSLWVSFFMGVLGYKAIEHDLARIAGFILLILILAMQGPFEIFSAATSVFLCVGAVVGFAQARPVFSIGQFLGLISYSLYLNHNPITGAAAFLSRKLFGVSVLANSLTLVVTVAASIAGAWIFWLIIERPAHRLTKKIKLQPGQKAARPFDPHQDR